MELLPLTQASFLGKRVVMRVDYNVSLGKGLKIVDDTRISRTLPTIKYILSHGASSLVLLSHLGRPGGKKVAELSLSPVALHLSELLDQDVAFESQSLDTKPLAKISLMENLRFDPREETGDLAYARLLANLGDIYINEAFGACHRADASVTGIPQYLPSFAGFGLIKEVKTLSAILDKPIRPLVLIIGGSKVRDKIGVLEKFSHLADAILIGGGMANTFLLANGLDLKKSLTEPDKIDFAKKLLAGQYGNAQIYLPRDLIWDENRVVDIGPETRGIFGQVIGNARTVVWNGPMGIFEDPRYKMGTDSIYEALISNLPAYVVVGGGDTLSSITDHSHLSRIDHLSTGGGAMLEFLEKGTLVGLKPLYIL